MWWWQWIPVSELGPACGSFAAPGPTATPVMPVPVEPVLFGRAAPAATNLSEEQRREVEPTAPAPRELTLGGRGPVRVPGAILGIIGRALFGPLGGLLSNLQITLPGRPATEVVRPQPADLRGLKETQVRDLARRAGQGDPEATDAIERWRAQMQAESAARSQRIDELIAGFGQETSEEVVGEVQLPADVPVSGDEEGSYNPGDEMQSLGGEF